MNILGKNLNSTCQGGYVDQAAQLIKVNGIPLESEYPYLAVAYTGPGYPTTNGICQANETYMYAQNPTSTTLKGYSNITADRMKELLVNGPVGALIYANSGFQSYSSGVYSGCPASFTDSYRRINHAVVVVGYDANGNYIIKNSWGTTWGESGYGVVSKDNNCGLTAAVYQYESSASPGNGLVYTNQIDLGS